MSSMERQQSTPVLEFVVIAGVAALGGLYGWVFAQLGVKGVVVGFAALCFGTAFILARNKTRLTQVGMVLSLALLLHKSFGEVTTTISSGAPSIYITTLDVALVVLYLLWFLEGTMWSDIRDALRRPVFWIPLLAALLSASSMLVAESVRLSMAEIVRWGWMYLLFVYLGSRLRSRREVGAILGALAGIALIELVVVVLQWKTGGVLGLSFLGVPTELGERTLDSGQLGRPFGTVIHPVFMGALLGTLALVALSLALFLERTLWRALSAAMVVVCLIPLILSHTRAAALAFVIAATVLGSIALVQRRVPWRVVRSILVVGVVGLVFSWPLVSQQFADNFATDHFRLEVESRTELNHVAVEMFTDSPIVGIGLNNFEEVMGPYDRYGLIFGDNPVHNLFLLQLAEAGLIGLIALLLLGWALFVLALRLTRSSVPLDRALGYGMIGVLIFFLFEEQLGFSLRQDVPLAVFWVLAGVCAACARLAGTAHLSLVMAPYLQTGDPVAASDRVAVPMPSDKHRRRTAARIFAWAWGVSGRHQPPRHKHVRLRDRPGMLGRRWLLDLRRLFWI